MYLDLHPFLIPHVSRMSPSYQIQLSLDAFEIHCISSCILDVSRMYLNVFCISDTYLVMTRPRYMYRDFVSRFHPVPFGSCASGPG
jgi:hypothetical protein